ncbi:unnamed protein product [Meloidogyne enterolobii]|uniref:Uncharacterized protein n=1 Tax=Meloidogyne enterolobii TaxID=390850 RepID=A0ACB0ZTD9_MELEN
MEGRLEMVAVMLEEEQVVVDQVDVQQEVLGEQQEEVIMEEVKVLEEQFLGVDWVEALEVQEGVKLEGPLGEKKAQEEQMGEVVGDLKVVIVAVQEVREQTQQVAVWALEDLQPVAAVMVVDKREVRNDFSTQVAAGESKQCCSCGNSGGCYQTSPQQTSAGGSVAVQPVAVQPTGTAQASGQPQKGYGDVRKKKFSSRHRQRQIFGRGTMVNHMAMLSQLQPIPPVKREKNPPKPFSLFNKSPVDAMKSKGQSFENRAAKLKKI